MTYTILGLNHVVAYLQTPVGTVDSIDWKGNVQTLDETTRELLESTGPGLEIEYFGMENLPKIFDKREDAIRHTRAYIELTGIAYSVIAVTQFHEDEPEKVEELKGRFQGDFDQKRDAMQEPGYIDLLMGIESFRNSDASGVLTEEFGTLVDDLVKRLS